MQNPGPNYNYNSGNQTSPYMPGLAAAGITAGAQIGGTIASGIGAGKRQKKQHQHQMNMAGQQYRHNKKLANLAFQNNMKAIAAQNAYNTPAKQMARYKAAGLNPNLVVGQGSPGNQTQTAQYQQQPTNYQQIESPHSPISGYEVFGAAIQNGISGIQQHQNIEQSRQQIEMSQMDLIFKAATMQGDAAARNAKNLIEVMLNTGGKGSPRMKQFLAETERIVTLGSLQRANTLLSESQARLNDQNVKQSGQWIAESQARVNKIQEEVMLLGVTRNIKGFEENLIRWRDQYTKEHGYDPQYETALARLYEALVTETLTDPVNKKIYKGVQEFAKKVSFVGQYGNMVKMMQWLQNLPDDVLKGWKTIREKAYQGFIPGY